MRATVTGYQILRKPFSGSQQKLCCFLYSVPFPWHVESRWEQTPLGCTWTRSLNALPLVSLFRSCLLGCHHVCPHCSDSQDMSHHPHRRTSGSGLLERGAGRKAARQLNPGFWQLVRSFSFFNLDSLPPTSWDAGFTLTCLKASREGKVLLGIG